MRSMRWGDDPKIPLPSEIRQEIDRQLTGNRLIFQQHFVAISLSSLVTQADADDRDQLQRRRLPAAAVPGDRHSSRTVGGAATCWRPVATAHTMTELAVNAGVVLTRPGRDPWFWWRVPPGWTAPRVRATWRNSRQENSKPMYARVVSRPGRRQPLGARSPASSQSGCSGS